MDVGPLVDEDTDRGAGSATQTPALRPAPPAGHCDTFVRHKASSDERDARGLRMVSSPLGPITCSQDGRRHVVAQPPSIHRIRVRRFLSDVGPIFESGSARHDLTCVRDCAS